MKLTEKLKTKINSWFNSHTPEEVVEISEKYGIKTKDKCLCDLNAEGKQISGWCYEHRTDWL